MVQAPGQGRRLRAARPELHGTQCFQPRPSAAGVRRPRLGGFQPGPEHRPDQGGPEGVPRSPADGVDPATYRRRGHRLRLRPRPGHPPAYADLQVARVAQARGSPDRRPAAGRRPHPGPTSASSVSHGSTCSSSTSRWLRTRDDERMSRGRLRVYLARLPASARPTRCWTRAAAAGARHRRGGRRGRDPRPRPDRGTLDGLEVVPPLRSPTGARVPRDGPRRRAGPAPEVVLVDELAHTNVPGGRHEKRWQDVEELLDAGIDVITTVNIQHLESLNDVVEQITGVPQRETVPDEVVRRADQIELVDMAPQALRRRMAHGNVYPPSGSTPRCRTTSGSATSPRCASWRCSGWPSGSTRACSATAPRTASPTWEARERVVVALTGGPEGETLIRRAVRIADPDRGRRTARRPRHPRRRTGRRHRPSGRQRSWRVHGRLLPPGGRRRHARGPPRLRPGRQRHPARARRQPPRPWGRS